MARKNYASATEGPAAVREWQHMDPRKDGCPCVIRRRRKYLQTNMARLSKTEALFKVVKAFPESERHPLAIENLTKRVENRKAWVEFSLKTLRNSVRYAMARIAHCPTLTAKCGWCRGQVTQQQFDDYQTLLVTQPANAKGPARGRTNEKWHRELRYIHRVLEQFVWAKTAAACNSQSEDALKELMRLSARAIDTFKYKSGREVEDAEQMAVLGIMRAAELFDPDKANYGKFTTYASQWIRRMTQSRKTSHCRPGIAVIKGKHVKTGKIDVTEGDEARADQYHPGTREDNTGLKLDVRDALSTLDTFSRELVMDHLVHRVTLKELAARHDLTPNKVKMILDSIKAQLALKLSDHG